MNQDQLNQTISIIHEVALRWEVDPKHLVGNTRNTKPISDARAVAMYLVGLEVGVTMTTVAKAFGNRNPSTVSKAVSKLRSKMISNEPFRQRILNLRTTKQL